MQNLNIIISVSCQGNSFILTKITTKTEIKIILKPKTEIIVNKCYMDKKKLKWQNTQEKY